MKISRRLAHRLQNLIQMVMSYIDLKKEDKAKKTLHEMSRVIHEHTVDACDEPEDCANYKPKDKPK